MLTTTEDLARLCHEVNRAICEASGDMSQPTWADAPQWQRDATFAGIEFRLQNPDAPIEASHNEWCQKKYEDGWQLGSRKNPNLKTHPCLVPFSDLPLQDRIKDHVFTMIVSMAGPVTP